MATLCVYCGSNVGNNSRFYQPLIDMLSQMMVTGFLHEEQLAQFIIGDHPETMIEKIFGYQHRLVNKWMD